MEKLPIKRETKGAVILMKLLYWDAATLDGSVIYRPSTRFGKLSKSVIKLLQDGCSVMVVGKLELVSV